MRAKHQNESLSKATDQESERSSNLGLNGLNARNTLPTIQNKATCGNEL